MTQCSVVPPAKPVSEVDFATCVTEGLSRAERKLGSRIALAAAMGLESTKQVGNILKGASTDPKRLFDAHVAAPDAEVLTDVANLYGLRLVPKGALCTSDGKLSKAACALLAKAIDAEARGMTSHTELLGMEPELRQLRAIIDGALEEVANIRRPRAA